MLRNFPPASVYLRLPISVLLVALVCLLWLQQPFFVPVHADGPNVITVDSAGDAAATDAACTLREAIANANADSDSSGGDCAAGSGADVIVFAEGLLTQTITLTNGELNISDDLLIRGPAGSLQRISAIQQSRVLSVAANVRVELHNLALSDGRLSSGNGGGISNAGTLHLYRSEVSNSAIIGGSTTEGGGIYNTGVLTLTASTVYSNSSLGSSGRGGGISSAPGAAATLQNSTIAANTAQAYGGGILADGPLTLINSTIVDNEAIDVSGGGLYSTANGAEVVIQNTILANNTDSSGANDCERFFSSPDSQGYNLVENPGDCSFSATGDVTGQDPQLAALALNDGSTRNHMLQATSPAIDQIPAGSNGCADTVLNDQRGYLRAANRACDIGSVEYNGIKLTLRKWVDDSSVDPTQVVTYTAVFTLWPSGNVSLTNVSLIDPMPSGINFVGPATVDGGSGGSSSTPPVLFSGLTLLGGNTLTLTYPVSLSTGIAAGSVITNTVAISSDEVILPLRASTALTVNNIGPVAVADTPTVLEDSGVNTITVRSNDIDPNGDTLSIVALGATDQGGSARIAAGVITYEPATNFYGTEVFTYTIADAEFEATATVSVTINAVNDAPSFSPGGDAWAIQQAGLQTITTWATSISPGPANELGQALQFVLTAANPSLFATPPQLDPLSGTLSYEPTPTESGVTTVTVRLMDDGGTANGGLDSAPVQVFTVTILTGDVATSLNPAGVGRLLALSDGLTTSLIVPAGAVTQPTDLVFKTLTETQALPPAGFVFAGRVFTLDAFREAALLDDFTFERPITLTLSYDPADLDFIDPASLELRYWDGAMWADDGITVVSRHPARAQLTVTLTHLTEFALFGQTPVLGVQKTAAAAKNFALSSSLTYTIVISNGGGAVARDVALRDVLPPGLSFGHWVQQGSAMFPPADTVVTWGPYDIQPGEVYTVQFTADLTSANAFAEVLITNTAIASSSNAGLVESAAVFRVAANTPPTLTTVSDQDIPVNGAVVVTTTLADLESPLNLLSLSTAADDPDLLTGTNFAISNAGAVWTVGLTPTANVTGTTLVTLIARDEGGLTATTEFVLRVNGPPRISTIANRSTNRNVPTPAIGFIVGDAETESKMLTLKGDSSNRELVPVENIIFGGLAGRRTVQITPAFGLTGTAEITIRVTDGGGLTSQTRFTLRVNGPPHISSLVDQTINRNTSTVPLTVTLRDAETSAAVLNLSAFADDPLLIPEANIGFSGSGGERSLMVTPRPNLTGTTRITVRVTDEGGLSAETSFNLTVSGPPRISGIGPQKTNLNVPTAPIAFSISDAESAAANLVLSAQASNPALVSAANIGFGGSGGQRNVVITPTTNVSGTSLITLTVRDPGGLSAVSGFTLTVNAPPRISAIANQQTLINIPVGPITFTVSDALANGTLLNALQVSAAASNPTLLPPDGLILGGAGITRTLILSPARNVIGSSTVTLTVRDTDSLSSTTTFQFLVEAYQSYLPLIVR